MLTLNAVPTGSMSITKTRDPKKFLMQYLGLSKRQEGEGNKRLAKHKTRSRTCIPSAIQSEKKAKGMNESIF